MAHADRYPADSRDEDDGQSGGDYPERRSPLHQRRGDEAVPKALGLHMVHGAEVSAELTSSLHGLPDEELDGLRRYQAEQASEGPAAA